MTLTQYYTATSLEWLFRQHQDRTGPLNYDEFYAGVGAVAMGSTTYEWIFDHEGARCGGRGRPQHLDRRRR